MHRLALTLLLGAALLAGCGEEREPAPNVFGVEPPRGAKATSFRAAGIELERPRNWKLRRRDPPGVFEILSGVALVTAWAYPREEDLPETDEQLEAAQGRLIEAVEERDPSYRLIAARTTEVAGAPALDLRGRQRISQRTLQIRSVHVFEGEVEYVFEAIAPIRHFRRTNRVLEQVLDSAELTGEVAESRR